MKKFFAQVTDTIKDVSEDVTKPVTESSRENKTLRKINDKTREKMNDRCILASFLLSLLSKITNFEHTSQLKVIKDSHSKWAMISW